MAAVTDERVAAPSGFSEPAEAPGELAIVERRTWATWQLAAACGVTLLVGMGLGYSGKKPAVSSGERRGIVSLGGLASATSLPTRPRASTATTLTEAPSTTLTTTASGPSTTIGASAAGPVRVLVPNTTGTGPSQLPAFTTTGAWSIGWAFRCTLAPGGSGPFTITVVSDASPASTPAVQQTSREGNGVTPESSTGHHHLQISTDPACQWAVKVTGAG